MEKDEEITLPSYRDDNSTVSDMGVVLSACNIFEETYQAIFSVIFEKPWNEKVANGMSV